MMTKAFNLELAKQGKKFQTKLGNPVRFITVSYQGKLIVAVNSRCTNESAEKYCLDGRKYQGTETAYDLEMVDEYEVA